VAMERLKQKRWPKIVLYIVILIGLSVGLALLMKNLDIAIERFSSTAYLVVFITTLVSNAGIVVPVAIHISIMVAAASEFDPVLVALVASVAGTLGEITGYYAGYLGKKIAFAESTPGYGRLVAWMERNGPWAIFVISLQPILPVDIAGLVAGASKIPLWKFLVPCWAGKFPKYILICYFGAELLRLLPI
jgi:uncharacterized membrane protein YdjX (TVP38/TMEM64 family)